MSEKLDPEEVSQITGRIFDGIKSIVKKYEGSIENFAGDGVLALFGFPRAHEDDPIRAIRAAQEIHGFVEALSPQYEKKIGRPFPFPGRGRDRRQWWPLTGISPE